MIMTKTKISGTERSAVLSTSLCGTANTGQSCPAGLYSHSISVWWASRCLNILKSKVRFFIIVTIIIITIIVVLVAKLLPVQMPCTNCRVLTKVLNGSNRRFLLLTPLTYKFNWLTCQLLKMYFSIQGSVILECRKIVLLFDNIQHCKISWRQTGKTISFSFQNSQNLKESGSLRLSS